MNRTQAKARAVELGISKDEARQFGNLNKTQTWLDAIAAREAQLQIEEEESPPLVVETFIPLCADPWDEIAQQSELIANAPTSELCDERVIEEGPEWTVVPAPAKTLDLEPQTKKAVAPQSSTLVYPLLLLVVALWIACQLLLNLVSLLGQGLTHFAQQTDEPFSRQGKQLNLQDAEPTLAGLRGVRPKWLQSEE